MLMPSAADNLFRRRHPSAGQADEDILEVGVADARIHGILRHLPRGLLTGREE